MRPQAHPSALNTRFTSPVQLGLRSIIGQKKAQRSMQEARYGEGPRLLRLWLVMSSMSPLFLLWAVRGTDLMPTHVFWAICAAFVIIPNVYLIVLVRRAITKDITREIAVGASDDHRQDLISYLFAMLLPFYSVGLGSWNDFAATALAVAIVVILFLSLNLHYLNFFIALFGYHCFQVHTPETEHADLSAPSFMVITKRPRLRPGSTLIAYRISPSVLLEVNGAAEF